MMKKLGILLVVVLLGVGLAGHYLWTNLDGLVKKAVETYGSAATQTVVSLGRVHIAVAAGAASLEDLAIGSPQGFSAPQALALGGVAVKMDPASVLGTGPIVIREIKIEKPQVAFEVLQNGDTNLQVLARNAKTYAASFSKADKASQQKEQVSKEQAAGAKDEASRKIIIEHLVISDGRIEVRHALLPTQNIAAALPVIHLKDIGKDKQGATPAEIAELLAQVFAENATKVAMPNINQQLEALKGQALEKINRATGGALGGSVGGGVGTQLEGQIKGLWKKK